MKLFCFGTLKSGYGNNRLLQGHELLGSATLHGYKMYYSGGRGSFPVIVPSEGDAVKGELWDIGDDKNTLQNLDYLEGYRKDNPDRSMYIRTPVSVSYEYGDEYGTNVIENDIDCETYVWNLGISGNYQEVPKNNEGQYEWSR